MVVVVEVNVPGSFVRQILQDVKPGDPEPEMIRNAKANALNRRKSLVKRNEEVLISYPADADRVLMDNSDDLET